MSITLFDNIDLVTGNTGSMPNATGVTVTIESISRPNATHISFTSLNFSGTASRQTAIGSRAIYASIVPVDSDGKTKTTYHVPIVAALGSGKTSVPIIYSRDYASFSVSRYDNSFTLGLVGVAYYNSGNTHTIPAGTAAAATVTITFPRWHPFYGSVNGKSKLVQKLYYPVNGKSKEITKLYGSVNGKSKLIYQS